MKKRKPEPTAKKTYSRFAVAVAIYVIGIVAFSTWSYIEYLDVVTATTGPNSAERQNIIPKVALIESTEIIFLLIIAIPLIALYHRARARSSHQVEKLNTKLRSDWQKLKKHETELEEAIRDLERFNTVATGREQRILELKAEVNALLQQLNRPIRYNTTPSE